MPKEYWRQNASNYITSLKTRKVFINVLEIEPTIGQTINGSLSVTVHSAINNADRRYTCHGGCSEPNAWHTVPWTVDPALFS